CGSRPPRARGSGEHRRVDGVDLVVAPRDRPERAPPQDVAGELAVEGVGVERVERGLQVPDEVRRRLAPGSPGAARVPGQHRPPGRLGCLAADATDPKTSTFLQVKPSPPGRADAYPDDADEADRAPNNAEAYADGPSRAAVASSRSQRRYSIDTLS